MLNLFSRWRANSKTLSGDVVIRVLGSIKTDVLEGKRRLLDEIDSLEQEERENIAPIIRGVETRLSLLESLWDASTFDQEVDDHLSSMFERPSGSSTVLNEDKRQNDSPANTRNETTVLIAVSLLFLTAAVIPGYKGFAVSMADDSVGTTGDADFYYLIQSNIMAVLGNLVMVIPLFRSS
ncbi:hypothetical protein G6514_003192 [Epicoccum nigrum]|nr:hypothetical protein G6514_003192 [Epicoccum nigrum]